MIPTLLASAAIGLALGLLARAARRATRRAVRPILRRARVLVAVVLGLAGLPFTARAMGQSTPEERQRPVANVLGIRFATE